MNDLPIPKPDAIAVPGEVGLILFLLYLTFFLHIVLMNGMLGGIFLTFVSECRARWSKDETNRMRHEHLAEKLGHVVPFLISLTVTFGIAPLLFVQGLYGQFFYTSSVLIAWVWLSVVLLIIVGYYSVYLYTRGFERYKNRRAIFITVSLVMFSIVAFIYVNNVTLMQTPQKWLDIYTKTEGSGWHWNMDEATLWPRYLHFLISAVAVAGMMVMELGSRLRTKDPSAAAFMLRWGGIWFLVATILQVGVGLWFYYAIPEHLRAMFLVEDGAARLLFITAHVLFLIGVAALAMTAFGSYRSVVMWAGILATLAGIAMKIINRDQLRQAYLRDVQWSVEQVPTKPQHDVITIFFVALLLGTGVLVWVIRQYRREVSSNRL